jgi:DNA-binding PadR family transcriptional regulator
VFIALSRLQAKGLVLSRLDTAESGRMRRYVKLTKRGLAVVKAHQVEHARLWRGLASLLKTPRT